MGRILIVDDEAGIRESVAGILSDEGFDTDACADGERALKAIARKGPFDLVLLDIAMPGRDGVAILHELRDRWPDLPVVMISGHGTIETAVRTTRMGAFDFIEKPLSVDKLLLTVQHALDDSRLRRENADLRAQNLRTCEILGVSDVIAKLRESIRLAAPSDSWVLVTGESGTGKELVARQIHLQSRRSTLPFVEVNCAAIPEELIESELFGHERGAFTGAVARKRGLFEVAHGGTIFLDEVADMSLMTQSKVLRMLQEQTFVRVGGTETIEVNVRIIAATNRNLRREIAAGRYREDLYYRLNVIPLRVPPLRERREDIEILAEAFVVEFCAAADIERKTLAPAVMDRLRAHAWPGNVREMRNLMERLVVMTSRSLIESTDLPTALAGTAHSVQARGDLEAARRDFEREYLMIRLREFGWNISRTASAIGLARESLSRKLRALEIDVPRG